jgi:hypothetical protein
MSKLFGLICCLAILVARHEFVAALFEAEMDNLALRFATGLTTVNNRMGISDGAPCELPSKEADIAMQKLYKSIENIVTEKRQRSANHRSSVISKCIVT